jgi:putative ABC transport system permease protein
MTRSTLLLLFARMRSHPWRSLVVTGAVTVASGIALSALAVLAVADDPWAPLVEATRGADVELDGVSTRPDPEELAALPGVVRVGDPIESGDAALQAGGDLLLGGLTRMPDDRVAMEVDRPFMITGRWFQSDREVVLEATYADTLGVEVGDEVTLSGGRSRTVRVVGTAATTMRPSYPESLPGSAYVGSALYDSIGPVGSEWSLGLHLEDPSRAHDVAADINDELGCTGEDGGCARSSTNIRDQAFPQRADDNASVMLFFAVLMLIASVMLVVTLLGSRLVTEARELTLLQVAGVTPRRLVLLIALEHALLAVVGVLAGALLARVVAPRITESAATVVGSVSPTFAAADVVLVGAITVACTTVVSAIGGLRSGPRSLSVVARGGSGRVRRSRIAAVALLASSRTTLVLGLKDIATRRGRAIVTVLTVALAVTMAVAIVGLGTTELDATDPTIEPADASALPADPEDISRLPVWPSAVSGEVVDRLMRLITSLQVLLGGVAIATLLAAASMTLQERLRELGTLHAIGCTTPQLVGASAVSHGALGIVGTIIGVPLGLALHLVLTESSGEGIDGAPPPGSIALIAVAAVALAAAAAALPALLLQRHPTSQALAAD